MLICKILGLIFGLICVALAAQDDPNIWCWKNPLMWNILINRTLIGVLVGCAGFMVKHPVFGFRVHPILRGAIIGAFVSLDMAVGVFMAPDMTIEKMKMIFWGSIGVGSVYGLIIDFIATKIAGEGKVLMKDLE